MSGGECPGRGECHNAAWCPECGDVGLGPCRARAEGGRCDAHPGSAILRPELEDARHDLACAEEDLGEAERVARVAEAEAARYRERAASVRRQRDRIAGEVAELQASLTAALRDELGGDRAA